MAKLRVLQTILALVIVLPFLALTETAKAPKDGLDYKLPFVTFYANENHRGAYYHHYLKKECTNLPSTYDDWASSMNTYRRCVFVCEHRDCGGNCERVHNQGSKGLNRLGAMGLNDKVSSVKFCYTFAERG